MTSNQAARGCTVNTRVGAAPDVHLKALKYPTVEDGDGVHGAGMRDLPGKIRVAWYEGSTGTSSCVVAPCINSSGTSGVFQSLRALRPSMSSLSFAGNNTC